MRTAAASLAAAALLAVAPPGHAQTRLSIGAGVLVPLGKLDEVAEPSLRAALQAEFQALNARGKRSLLGVRFHVAYTDLSVEGSVRSALVLLRRDPDASLLEAGGSVRAYSRWAPFFVGGGAAWIRYQPPGGADARHGVDLHAGAGFQIPLGLFLAEPEAAGHVVFLEGGDIQFLSATLGIALPF